MSAPGAATSSDDRPRLTHPTRRSALTRPSALLAAAVTFVTAPALAALYVFAHDGFGAGDLAPFALWSAFLGALVAAAAPPVLRGVARHRRPVAVALAALAGAGLGVLFTFVVVLGLGPMVNAFSFPILYIWVAAAAGGLGIVALVHPVPVVTASDPPRGGWRRALVAMALVLVAAVAFPFVMMFGALVWNRAEPEIHLLPAEFERPVVIIFGDSAGAPVQREGRARLYEIPADGVLRTRFPPNPGWGLPHYYVDAVGRRVAIARGAPCDDSLPGDPVQACLMPHMYIGNQVAPEYDSYVVTRQVNRQTMDARWDSLVHWAVFRDSAYRPPDASPPR